MKWLKTNIYWLLGILITSIAICFDLFTHIGTPATMDANIHITTINQFYQVIRSGEFPVTWLDKFANYGQPVPLFAHQLPNYLGAFLMFVTHNPVMTFNVLVLLSIFLSACLFYYFLNFYFSPAVSFLSTILFSLAPYRIVDVYIRGDLPELVSEIFLPIILIGLYLFIKRKKIFGFYLTLFSIALLALTHPMMLLIYAFFYLPYMVFLIISLENTLTYKLRIAFLSLLAVAVGTGIASYYLLPLKMEMKYFYFGQTSPIAGHFDFSWANIFLERWQSHTDSGILTRVQIIQTGLPETLLVIAGLFMAIKSLVRNKKKKVTLLITSVVSALIILFFALPYSEIIYDHTFLQNIQFPWRMMAIFLFIPPIILGIILERLGHYLSFQRKLESCDKKWIPDQVRNDRCVRSKRFIFLYLLILVIILLIRVPQLYGKDYVVHPIGSYDFTTVNLNSVLMNPVWTGKTESYPVESTKPGIITGSGRIVSSIVRNDSRTYVIDAKTPLRMVDYTFYFPGWNVKVDNQSTPIQYQDPQYRGVITYNVPMGKHIININYGPTLVEKTADILSLIFIGVSFILLILRKWLSKLVYSE